MNEDIYFGIKKLSRKKSRYLFLDANNRHLADSVFAKMGVPVRFDDELVSPDGKWAWRFCWVKKPDEKRFLDAMERMKSSFLLCGYTDYKEEVMRFRTAMDET